MSRLEQIIAKGNRTFDPARFREKQTLNIVRCADGFTVSVIAGEGCYCSPRPNRYAAIGSSDEYSDHPGPYRKVEVGYPSQQPEPWDEWRTYAEAPDDPTGTVYGWVPVEMVRALVAAHGGESA